MSGQPLKIDRRKEVPRMQETTKHRIHRFIKLRTQQRRAYAMFTALAILVSLSTTCLLIRPASTMTTEVLCGLEEHTHTEACFARILVFDLMEDLPPSGDCTQQEADPDPGAPPSGEALPGEALPPPEHSPRPKERNLPTRSLHRKRQRPKKRPPPEPMCRYRKSPFLMKIPRSRKLTVPLRKYLPSRKPSLTHPFLLSRNLPLPKKTLLPKKAVQRKKRFPNRRIPP